MRYATYLLVLTAIVVVVIGCFGCSEIFPGDGRFYVKDIEILSRKSEKIQAVSIKGRGSFFFIDTQRQYKIGDTIQLIKVSK
jgi:hypothetical protein